MRFWSRRLANGMGDTAGVSAQARGIRNEEKRAGNYALRRAYQAGRPGEAVAVDINGVNIREEAEAQAVMNQRLESHVHREVSNFKCRDRGSISARPGSFGEKASSSPSSSSSGGGKVTSGKLASSFNVYRIVISLVAVLFLLETVTHGFVFLLFRHTDLQAESLEIFPRVFGRASRQAAAESGGEDVRFVPTNVVERLLLSKGKATVAELRKEARSPVRFPRLALVRITCGFVIACASRCSLRGEDVATFIGVRASVCVIFFEVYRGVCGFCMVLVNFSDETF